ncbi:MAG: hypothetical protein R2834_12990 [Rhodothermales bacterium]
MTKHTRGLGWAGAITLALVVAWAMPERSVVSTLTLGDPAIQSIGALTFGPENILIVGDSKSASVVALDVMDTDAPGDAQINVGKIDAKIAGLLGVEPSAVTVHDMAVHPATHNVYLSVSRGQGPEAQPVLLKVGKDGALSEIDLKAIRFSKAALANAPAADATDNRGRSLRTNAITDLAYRDGKVYVAGLSNEEFASSLRQLDFPFKASMTSSSLEIFHVAHGQYETHAPVRTFMPYDLGGQAHILAAYTCTPLVAFQVSGLQDGAHVKGTTVAELGYGNTPLDIVSYTRDGQDYLLLANTNRTVMKIKASDLVGAASLTEPLQGDAITAGVAYTALPRVGVLQLDTMGDEAVVMLQREVADGSLSLRSYGTDWF